MKRLSLLLLPLSIMLVFAACSGNGNNNTDNQSDSANENNNVQNEETADNESSNNGQQADDANQENEGETVEVDLENGDEESVGTATLKEVDEGVKVTYDGENLPKGTHAFHIHEKGVCEAPDFKSAEGHFNPDDSNHGFDDEEGPHAGDMPNIVVGEDGTVHQSYIAENVTFEEGEDNSLFGEDGTSLVIHEGADDGESQPSGDAGDRMACGVIEK